MILDLIDEYKLKKQDCVMIGDSASDYQAAKNAGIDGYLFDSDNIENFMKSVKIL